MAGFTGVEPIGSIIRRVLKNQGLEQGVKQGEALSAWNKIVGDIIAQHSSAVALEQEILFIRVDDSAWRNELAMMSEEIIEKINAYFGDRRVNRIHII